MKRIIFLICIFLSPFISFCKIYSPFILNHLGKTIYEGLFTGNGLLGTMTYLKDENTIRIDIGRTDVYDHRMDTSLHHLFSKARLPIGHFEISFINRKIDHVSGEMNISSADATAFLTIGNDKVSIKSTTLAHKNIFILEISQYDISQDILINFVPSLSISPRSLASYVNQPPNYLPNPTPIISKRDGITYINQTLTAGGGYVTAYKILTIKNQKYIIGTIGYRQHGQEYIKEAKTILNSFSINKIAKELAVHKKHWKDYMSLSDYIIPDPTLQQFYDLQMYKLGCLTGKNKPMIDLQGPWAESYTPWPAYWYNLNMQLTYSPIFTANRLNLVIPLIKALNSNHKNLQNNIHPDYRYDSFGLGRSGNGELLTGQIKLHKNANHDLHQSEAELSNLTWLLMSYYQYYRYSMDIKSRTDFYYLLKRSVNFALHFLEKKDGKYQFIVKTHSPEYSDKLDYNTNYDLAILRWGIKILMELIPPEEKDLAYIRKIEDINLNLIDYPTDKTGYKISSNQSYENSHRHYSHLMMIYPFYLIDFSDKESKLLALKSIEYWQSKRSALQGYSLSGAASMYASFGNGDKALFYIKDLHKRFIQPNTLYKESGPVIETPLALANSIQELSLQCWQDTVRIFPAVPTDWKYVSFKKFRVEGAFLINASKIVDTLSVEILSEYGGEIKMKFPDSRLKIKESKFCEIRSLHQNIVHAYIPKGKKLIIEGIVNN